MTPLVKDFDHSFNLSVAHQGIDGKTEAARIVGVRPQAVLQARPMKSLVVGMPVHGYVMDLGENSPVTEEEIKFLSPLGDPRKVFARTSDQTNHV
jgi:hypothetical protein